MLHTARCATFTASREVLLVSGPLFRTELMASSNRIEQQDTERRHVEAFLEAVHLKPAIEPGDHPDFVLALDGQRVGLEHSELYDESLQKNRALVKRFEALLGEEMRARGAAADLDVSLYFAASSTFFADNPSAMRPLAAQVAAAVVQTQPAVPVGAQTTVTVGPATVRIHRIRNLTEGPFGAVQPFCWADGKQMVRVAVHAKEQKLDTYRKQLSEVWLLLVTGETWTQTADSVLLDGFQLSSSFDRVYLLDLRTGEAKRLDDNALADS